MIKFALKYPTKAALFDPQIKSDYKNMNVEISSSRKMKTKEGFPTLIDILCDYQHYYHPDRTIADIDLQEFVSDAQIYMKEYILNSALNITSKDHKIG